MILGIESRQDGPPSNPSSYVDPRPPEVVAFSSVLLMELDDADDCSEDRCKPPLAAGEARGVADCDEVLPPHTTSCFRAITKPEVAGAVSLSLGEGLGEGLGETKQAGRLRGFDEAAKWLTPTFS
jgi:hypothetical protein